jgi:DNA polymerase-3 subunit gamma/tau
MSSDNYLVFSLKYRPQTFDEILCQEPVRETLKKAIENNRVAHSYLFCGPRGVGKTTTARILAKALNCVKGPTVTPCGVCAACKEIAASRSMDVIEIDGASNRQIDDIRDLRENIKYAPTSGKYKVYIIDEVHMLTEFAFNALLKTLEEPPRHAKFVFATTAPHKVPSTILSRCQRFDFRKAAVEELVGLLQSIAKREKVKVAEEALFAIARRADGSIRDSETILDQMSSFRPEGIALADVEQLLGMVPGEVFYQFADLVRDRDPAALVGFVNQVFDHGYHIIEFFTGLANHLRSLLALKLGLSRDILGLSPADLKRLESQAAGFTAQQLSQILEAVVGFEESIKYTLMPRVQLEVMALRLAGLPTASASPAAAGPAQPVSKPATPRVEGASGQGTGVREDPEPGTAAAKTRGEKPVAAKPAGDTQALWEQTRSELHDAKPLLAGILEGVSIVSSTADALCISAPDAPMWDTKELAAEMKAVEATLSRIAGRPMRIEVAREARPAAGGGKKGGRSTLDKFRAVYDCEEL